MLGRLLALATRAPRATLIVLAAVAVAGAVAGVLVPVDGRLDRLAPSGSAAERAGETERASFGGDTAVIVIRGDMVRTLLDEADRLRVGGLEGCLGGIVDKKAKPGPCTRIRDLNAVKSVDGPITYLNSAIASIGFKVSDKTAEVLQASTAAKTAAEEQARKDGKSAAEIEQIGKAARNYVVFQSYAQLGAYAKDLGLDIRDDISIRNNDFAKRVLFAKGEDGKYGPKRRLAAVLPNRETAIIQVRLRGDLSAGERAEVTDALKDAMQAKQLGLGRTGATIEFTGLAPASQTLSDAIRRSALALGAAALMVMAVVLLLARRLQRRLLPILVAASVLGFALLALAIPEGALSLAVVVALPVLVGLAVDQAVQAQLRLERRMHPDALRTLVIAGSAAAASALALLASPFEVVRTVSIALAAAIVLAIFVAAAASAAAISLGRRKREAAAGASASADAAAPSAFDTLTSAAHQADEMVATSGPVRGTNRAARAVTSFVAANVSPKIAAAVLAIGFAVAIGGAVIGAKTPVETNLTALVPPDSSGARQLEKLRMQTGASSAVSLVVTTKNVGDPKLWRFLIAAQQQVAAGGDGRCDGRSLCNPLPLDELFGMKPGGKPPTDAQIEQTLSNLPSTLSRSLIDPDRGVVALPFGIGTLDGKKQRDLVAQLDRIAADAPRGAEAAVSGLPAVVAASAGALESPDRRIILASLAILLPGIVLLIALRSPRRAIVALVPPLMALGWSELAMWALGVPRTPLTAALGVLVAAVAVEFSVLLGERFAALRRVGLSRERAIASTLRETGGAVAISAGATIAGFGVLGLATIPVISQFGIATAIDLALVLLALVVVGPATWVLADGTPQQRSAPSTQPPRGRELQAQ